jgi:hypothetical protein
MALNPIHTGATSNSGHSGSGRCAKQYSPRGRESTVGEAYISFGIVVRREECGGGGGAKGKRSGIIKAQKVIEKRSEVKSL